MLHGPMPKFEERSGEIMAPSAMIPSYSGIRSPAQFQKLETESEYVKKIIKL